MYPSFFKDKCRSTRRRAVSAGLVGVMAYRMEDFVHFLRKDTHRVLVYRGDEEDILGLTSVGTHFKGKK